MSTRKRFLAAAASGAIIAASPASIAAATPSPAPSPSPSPKPSEAARALAQSMRKFDPNLGDTDLDKIAQGIDGNLKIGSSINRGGKHLKNWNEPATPFEATE